MHSFGSLLATGAACGGAAAIDLVAELAVAPDWHYVRCRVWVVEGAIDAAVTTARREIMICRQGSMHRVQFISLYNLAPQPK